MARKSSVTKVYRTLRLNNSFKSVLVIILKSKLQIGTQTTVYNQIRQQRVFMNTDRTTIKVTGRNGKTGRFKGRSQRIEVITHNVNV